MTRWFWIIFLGITCSAIPLVEKGSRRYLVIWNIGQGQWVTAINDTSCFHFDMGGEFFPWKRLRTVCGQKENQISISHWDSDHLNAANKWPSAWKACMVLRPLGTASARKEHLLARFTDCSADAAMKAQINNWHPSIPSKDTNGNSHVVLFENTLLPGDSTQKQEHLWKNEKWIQNSEILVLGHHGSKTSTSRELLTNLPKLRMTIASARWARYRHPHPATVSLLKRLHLPLLRTEDWGNIWLER